MHNPRAVGKGERPPLANAGRLGPSSRPAWHPNGQELAFTDFNSIHTIFVSGFGRAELDTSSNYSAYTPEHPAYSPSGTKLAFSDWKDNRIHIFVHTFTTGQTIDLGLGSNPAWSPEGSLIAFADGDGLEELWIMGSDGSERMGTIARIARSSEALDELRVALLDRQRRSDLFRKLGASPCAR